MSKFLAQMLCMLLVLSMLTATACTGGTMRGDNTSQTHEAESEPSATEAVGSETETQIETEAETQPPAELGDPREILVTTKGAVDNMKFSPLPLGQVKATSWLRNQLLLQAEQVTKEFEKLSPEHAEHILQIIKDLNDK